MRKNPEVPWELRTAFRLADIAHRVARFATAIVPEDPAAVIIEKVVMGVFVVAGAAKAVRQASHWRPINIYGIFFNA